MGRATRPLTIQVACNASFVHIVSTPLKVPLQLSFADNCFQRSYVNCIFLTEYINILPKWLIAKKRVARTFQ